jgi:hypothetical protein
MAGMKDGVDTEEDDRGIKDEGHDVYMLHLDTEGRRAWDSTRVQAVERRVATCMREGT